MRKLLAISWREIYTRFTDRTLLILMLLAPLGISTIVGLAFGGLGSGGSPVEHIPVLVLNQDARSQRGAAFGEVVVDLLVEGNTPGDEGDLLVECQTPRGSAAESATSLDDLIDGYLLDDEVVAGWIEEGSIDPLQPASTDQKGLIFAGRAAVDRGLYTALVVIPEGFSGALSALAEPGSPRQEAEIAIYANRGRTLEAGILRSVVEGIVNELVSGNIAIGVTLNEAIERQPAALAGLNPASLNAMFACAFSPDDDTASLDIIPVQSAAEDNPAGGILVAVGSAQGMFFALFTAQFGILSLYEERKNWTLQRMVASPTPRWAILGGKLVGVIGSIMFQLIALAVALTVVGSLLAGRPLSIWGEDIGMLVVLLLAIASAVGGLGMMMAGVLRSIEQANIVASVLNIALGVLGGAFGFFLPVQVAGISMIYWGREALQLLGAGQTDIGVHLLVLFGQGIILFSLGLFIFNRRFEVQ